jgi:uncharacterized membrane protein YqaE (UPF0057 family)
LTHIEPIQVVWDSVLIIPRQSKVRKDDTATLNRFIIRREFFDKLRKLIVVHKIGTITSNRLKFVALSNVNNTQNTSRIMTMTIPADKDPHNKSAVSQAFLGVLCFFVPPLAVGLQEGCGSPLIINIFLLFFLWIPAVIHALYVVLK